MNGAGRSVEDAREQRVRGVDVERKLRAGGRRERHAPDEHLVQHDAERIDVAAAIDRVGREDLLGRHVLGRAGHRVADGRAVARGQDARDAEVDHLDVILDVELAHEQHVVGLEVAMDDVGLVRGVERGGDLIGDAQRARDAERAMGIDLGASEVPSRNSNTMYGVSVFVKPMSVASTMFG